MTVKKLCLNKLPNQNALGSAESHLRESSC